MKVQRSVQVDKEVWDRVLAFVKVHGLPGGISELINTYLRQVDDGIKEGFFSKSDDGEAKEYLLSKLK